MATIILWLDRLTGITGKFFGWSIVPLVLALSYEVFARYLFGSPTIWAFDTTYMLMSAIFLSGAAYTLAEHRHIRVDFFYTSFSRRNKAIADLIGYLVLFVPVIFYTAFFAVKKFLWAIEVLEKSDMTPWHPIMWPFRGFIALGFVLLAVQCIAEILKNIRTLLRAGEGEENG